MTNAELFDDFWKFKLTDYASSITGSIYYYFKKNYLSGLELSEIEKVVLNLNNGKKRIKELDNLSHKLTIMGNNIKNNLFTIMIPYDSKSEKDSIENEVNNYTKFQELKSKYIYSCRKILNNNPYINCNMEKICLFNGLYHYFWSYLLNLKIVSVASIYYNDIYESIRNFNAIYSVKDIFKDITGEALTKYTIEKIYLHCNIENRNDLWDALKDLYDFIAKNNGGDIESKLQYKNICTEFQSNDYCKILKEN